MKKHPAITIIFFALLPQLIVAAPIERPKKGAALNEQVEFYLNRLGDATYGEKLKESDGHPSFWHTAPEELGQIGSPAVEPLIKKVQGSHNATELTWAFYALMLASQAPDIKAAIGGITPDRTTGDYIYPEHHARLKTLWLEWWAKNGTTIQNLADKQKTQKPQAEGVAPTDR